MVDRSAPSGFPNVGPCLAELFRTCVYPACLPLRIEKVLVETCNQNPGIESLKNELPCAEEIKIVHRLFLSDGVLVVQALLENRVLPLINLEDIVAGNTLVLKKLRIERAERLNGQGEVVFLAIADCDIVLSRTHAQQTQTKKRSAIEYLEEEEEEANMPDKKAGSIASSVEGSIELKHARKRHAGCLKSSQDSDSDDFETITIDRKKLESKRKALQELNNNRSFESPMSATPNDTSTTGLHPTRHPPGFNSAHKPTSATHTTTQPDPSTWLSHSAHISQSKQSPHQPVPTTSSTPSAPAPHAQQQEHLKPIAPPSPPPHQTLSSLLFPQSQPPKPQPPLTLFVIISWISPTLLHPRPHSPFPPKRHIKLHDQSISARHSGITVAVFCDAANFQPKVGTVAVLSGLVMQRIGGGGGRSGSGPDGNGGGEVILNAYERLMREGKRWFEDDEVVLEGRGWDVRGLRRWWEERRRQRQGGRV